MRLASLAAIAALALSCKPQSASTKHGASPGAAAGEAGAVTGSYLAAPASDSMEIDLTLAEYVEPKQAQVTPPDVEALLAKLPKSCDDGAGAASAAGDDVAVVLDGDCKVVTRAEARAHFQELAEGLALYGVDLAQVEDDKAGSEQLHQEEIGKPKIDLGKVVEKELQALGEPPPSAAGAPEAAAFALSDASDDWTGSGRSMTLGSSQFAGTVSGYAYVLRKNGVGVFSVADVTGRAFATDAQIVYASLEAKSLNGQRGQAKAVVRAFGSDLFNRTFEEPEQAGDRNLAELNSTKDGTIRFAVGPVPFSVTWAFRVRGSVPVTYAVRPNAADGRIHPSVAATVGLEGGPDIVIARAGVGGAFTIADTDFNAQLGASLQRRDTAMQVCYTADSAFSLRNMIGGRLFAFAQVGRPDRRVLRAPPGWRGELSFVNWAGVHRSWPIMAVRDQCTPVL